MISSYHSLELIVGGVSLDLFEGTGVRMNRNIFDPVSLRTTQAEYSYTFDLPDTPINAGVLGHAQAVSSDNKFNRRFACEVQADGVTVFSGTLSISGYDMQEKVWKANLVSEKAWNSSVAFGDHNLSEIDWPVPYSGATTINAVNADMSKKYHFPFIAYGVFEKDPYFSDEVASDYTDSHELDKWCRFYHETFMPSLNLVETVSKCFGKVGLNLKGDVLDDPVLNGIYMSTSLASEQNPVYNLANPVLGAADISFTWKNGNVTSTGNVSSEIDPLIQSLNLPYFRVYNYSTNPRAVNTIPDEAFNFSEIETWNALGSGSTVTENAPTYLYDPGECCLVIPADGFYKIDLQVELDLQATYNNGYVDGLQTHVVSGDTMEDTVCHIPYNLTWNTPVEVQLVRNVVNDQATLELIKGKNNKYYKRGIPYSGGTEQEYTTWVTAYPHEWKSRSVTNPTTSGGPGTTTVNRTPGRVGQATSRTGGTYDSTMGYFPADGDIFAYDPSVSPNFICGFSSFGGPTASVIKDGYSWYHGTDAHNEALYVQPGYLKQYRDGRTYSTSSTTFNANAYEGAPQSYCSVTGNKLRGRIVCAVYLNRNDIVTLNVIQRHYDYETTERNRYYTSMVGSLKMEAFTPKNKEYVTENGQGYLTPSQFDTLLQLGRFLNSGTTMASFVDTFQKCFNLDIIRSGDDVYMNTQSGKLDAAGVVDIDDRVDSTGGEGFLSSKIDWPSGMAVKWSVDTDEWGFWTTVPSQWHNSDKTEWERHGDSGYTVITMDTFAESPEEVELSWSFNWYDNFTLYKYDTGGTVTGSSTLTLPVIAPYSVMAPRADYGEAMKNDCLSMPLRLWFRQPAGTESVTLTNTGEDVYLSVPTGTMNGVDLRFDAGRSLLTGYFNVAADLSRDITEVQCYLTADEYLRIKNGAGVKFDDALWNCAEVSGYDPEGLNATTLKLIKA